MIKIAIGIGGKISSGKTTVAKYLSEKYSLPIYSYAQKVKELITAISSLDDNAKNNTDSFDGIVNLGIINSVLKQNGYKQLTQYEIDTINSIEYGTNQEVYRNLMQYIGTEIFRTRNFYHWINEFDKTVHENCKTYGFICDDVRFPNEHSYMKNKFDTSKTILLKNESDSINKSSHQSETMFDYIPFDSTIINRKTGLADLYYSVDQEFSNMLINN